MNKLMTVVVTVALACVFGLPALAQERTDRGRSGNSSKNPYFGSPLTWSVEPIIDNYVRQMTRYYNLTKDQEEYTRQLLTQRVKRFLNDYEGDVRALFAEYWYLQSKGEMPTPEQAKDLARRGGPLIAAIKKEILDGNQKWREILDEKQRKIHDRDLEQMNKVFDEFEERIDRWSRGDVRPSDVGKTKINEPQGPRPIEDAWEYKVNSFIMEYNLDAGQRETARSILRELRGEAARYRERNEEKFAALKAELKEIYNSGAATDPEEQKKAAEKVKKVNDQLNKLERPIREDLWRQLLTRLDRIPTEDQRRLRREKQERLVHLAGGRRPDSQAAGSQPASSPRPSTSPSAAASAD